MMCVKHVSIKHCYAVSAQQSIVIIIIVIVTIFWCAEVEPHACPALFPAPEGPGLAAH